MRKRIISIGLAICLLLGLMPGAWAAGLEVAAPSAILMDAATGTILWEKDAHTRLAPASVTKIMTLLLVLEALDSGKIGWDDTVTASDAAAAKGGSQVYLEPGEPGPGGVRRSAAPGDGQIPGGSRAAAPGRFVAVSAPPAPGCTLPSWSENPGR